MSKDPGDLEARLEFALGIARAAGERTMEFFRAPDLEVRQKADRSPVTAADEAAERLLRERIAEAYPQDGILGEEEEEVRGTSGWRWILDPIDGTESFRRGVPLFGTLVACEDEDDVRVGVVNCPAAGELVAAAQGLGARWEVAGRAPRPARVSTTERLDEALVATTAAGTVPDGLYEELTRRAGYDRGWGDCYQYLLVATGRAEVGLDPLMNVWDNAPLLVILEQAGGRFTDLEGRRTIRGGSALGTNGRLHEAVLELKRRAARS